MQKTIEKKALQLFNEGKVFLFADGNKHKFFVVGGSKGDIYNVTYFKNDGTFECTCKNIRLKPCYHIEGCKLYEGGYHEKDN